MITRATLSTIEQGLPKYRSMLAGNAAFAPGAFDSIASVSGNGSAQVLTISGIPSTYTHLQIRGVVRNNRNNPSFPFGNLSMYFNGSAGSNSDGRVQGNTSTASATGNAGITALTIGDTATDAQTANVMTTFIIDILEYTSTTKLKTVRSFIGTDVNGTGRMQMTEALYTATPAAITSISFENYNSAAFTTTTNFALYGIKGS